MLSALALAILFPGPPTSAANAAFDPGPNPLLMQHPTMNRTHIVFAFADALWSVSREGGRAVRLTVGPQVESDPYFSPDGTQIAFSANYDGNTDVYVMPAEGGTPKRLTAHPAPDLAVGWTPDGRNVLFSSEMLSNTDAPRLFTVPVTGGFPTPLPLPMGTQGCYSPDGKKLAFVPGFKWETAWKRYRGGQTYPIWIADLSDSRVKQIPRENTNDESPVWLGDKIYYLSDKRGPVGLYSYNTTSGKEDEEIKGEGFDIKSATAGPGGIVYERLGSVWILDTATHKSHRVPIEVEGDFLGVRPEFKNLRPYMDSLSLSPSGARVAVTARGWVMTVPASKGNTRLLNDQQGVYRREATWSPDGKTIAWFTDQAGVQQICLYDTASAKEKLVGLADGPGYYHRPTWSPDSNKIAYTDQSRSLWVLDVKAGKNSKIDQTIYNNPRDSVDPAWSPDSKWLTWARDLDNHFNAIFLYNLDTGKKSIITDGLAYADSPVFDRNGKFLYFYASTQIGQGVSWLDISSFNSLNSPSSVYAVVLGKDEPNPLQPESDEEPIKSDSDQTPKPPLAPPAPPSGAQTKQPPAKPEAPKPEAAKTVIDLDSIEQRIIALPLPPGVYTGLVPGPGGSLFVMAARPRATISDFGGGQSVIKFSFQDRKVTPFAGGVQGFQVTPDGSKALLAGMAGNVSIVPTAMPPAPGQGNVDLSDLTVKIDPKTEWESMYHDVWREERVLFYSPTMNGLDVDQIEKRYEPFVRNLQSRTDLNYLFDDMLGELCVGHEFPGGGDLGSGPFVPGGLLGADYTYDGSHYKLSRIYTGERWNPSLYAPLAQPGINAKVGEYVLAIDGHDLSSSTDIYEALEGKAGKQVKVRLGSSADGKGSREVVVVPVANEFGLRERAWEEDNRRYVAEKTHGRAGYVHVPDTAQGGWTAFNRFYYAQVEHDGMIVDERFNHGGLINDWMIREMQKPLDAAFAPRYNKEWPTPGAAIYGPKVMLINQFSGSGGDMFPWLFRHEKVGRLIGKRTWGGLIAAFGFSTIDGGHVNSPDIAFFDPSTGKWDVENWGVPPDAEVELDPYLWRQGHDAQLDAAIAEVNKELEHYKAPTVKRPAYPDRTKLGVRY